MRTAISIWDGRIAPLFDASENILIVECQNGKMLSQQEEKLIDHNPFRKTEFLVTQNVKTLICGAISCQFMDILSASGINVLPFIAGKTEQVINAYLENKLSDPTLIMPGCGQRRKRFQIGCFPQTSGTYNQINQVKPNRFEGETVMPNKDHTGPDGKGPGTGRGMGRCGGKNRITKQDENKKQQGPDISRKERPGRFSTKD